MKTITYEEFMSWRPCWLETPEGREKLRYYAKKRKRWSALNILALNRVSAEDRLWAVLREELIDAPILHEFACQCAEMALALIPEPDPRSIAAIEAKRKWLRGEIDNTALAAARAAAEAAEWAAERATAMAAECAALDAAMDAAMVAEWAALAAARYAARAAECAAARVAARAAAWAAECAAAMATDSAAEWAAAQKKQVTMLKQLLEA